MNHSLSGMFAIRQGDWKLIEGLGSGGFTAPRKLAPKAGDPKGQLYNLRDDPDESENLFQAMPEKVAELEKLLNSIRSSGRSRE